jgi:hypothetical protein
MAVFPDFSSSIMASYSLFFSRVIAGTGSFVPDEQQAQGLGALR